VLLGNAADVAASLAIPQRRGDGRSLAVEVHVSRAVGDGSQRKIRGTA
jgi:hypothetical protein